MSKKVKSLTLALGEVTGHHHTISANGNAEIEVLEDTEFSKTFAVSGTGDLVHQEHDRIVFNDELVVSNIQIEYDPFSNAVRRVMD